jgi:glycosyltransferase involved in cell wall biosynthesis
VFFLNILLVLKDLPKGGIEEVFYCLAAGFKRLSHQVDLVVLSNNLDEAQFLRFDRLCRNIFIFNKPSIIKVSFLYSLLKKRNYNLVISAKEKSNISISLAYLVFKLLNYKVKSKLVLTRHVSIKTSIAGADAKWYTPLLYVFYGIVSDHIVTCSKYLKNELLPYIRNHKVSAIYNPIIGQSFYDRKKSAYNVDNLIQNNAMNILFVGRVVHQKGLDLLLYSLLYVDKNIQLIIVGDGDELSSMNRLAYELLSQKRNIEIKFLGKLDNVLPLMSKVDLFVMPSRWEGLPTVLIEAIAVCTPVISSDCISGPSEIIPENYHADCLFAVESPKEIANKINNYSPERYLIKEFDISKFSEQKCCEEYLKLLSS